MHRDLTVVTCSASPDYNLPQLTGLNVMFDRKINQNHDTLLDSVTGWNGAEYDGFDSIPMYIGGKNTQGTNFLVGRALVGYDCSASKLCVAAYLDNPSYFVNSNCHAEVSDDDSWVTIDSGTFKYKQSSSSNIGFVYVTYPNGEAGNRNIGMCCIHLCLLT